VKREYLISGLVGAGVGALGYHLVARRAPAWVNKVLRDMEVTVRTREGVEFSFAPTLDKPNVWFLGAVRAPPESPIFQGAYVGCEDSVDPETLRLLPSADVDLNEPYLALLRRRNGDLHICALIEGDNALRVAFRGEVIVEKDVGAPYAKYGGKGFRDVFLPV